MWTAILTSILYPAMSAGVDWVINKTNKLIQNELKVDDTSMARDVYSLIQEIRAQANSLYNDIARKNNAVADIAASPSLTSYMTKVRNKLDKKMSDAERTVQATDRAMNVAEDRYNQMKFETYKGLGTRNRKDDLVQELNTIKEDLQSNVERKIS